MFRFLSLYKLFFFALFMCCWIGFSSCEKAFNIKAPDQSKTAVFNELWKVIDERYALFSVKKTDWNLVYNQFSLQVNEGMTDQSFFTVLSRMVDSLRDGHVTVVAPFFTYTYDGFYTLFTANFNYENVVNTYLKNEYKTSGPLQFKIVDNVGYIYYSSFAKELSEAAIDTVFDQMKNTTGIMIDVRNNTGGTSSNADRLFSRFINTDRLVKYEKIKSGPGHDEFYEPQPHSINPSGNYYSKKVAVLTNRKCFSTCNDFVMYMSYLPNVKIFGDQTGGGGAVPNEYILANGWKLRYSSTLTLSPDMAPVENGIAPDERIIITPIDEANGIDRVIEKAFQYLR